VGAPFTGLEKISATIRQAQSCVPETAQHMIVQVTESGEDSARGSEKVDLKPLQQALECWNQQEVAAQIDQLAVFAGKSNKTPPQELFYGILFLLRDAAGSGKLSFSSHEKLVYQSNSSPTANLRRLKAIAEDLFQQKAALQMTDKQILCQEIVQHIETHFSDATLCMASLSKQFGVSERFVYNAVLDSTGMNVSNFLARCRMQEAARLLRETQETIGSIAEKCGYPVESTFYRNFKKYYHVTPAEYKAAY